MTLQLRCLPVAAPQTLHAAASDAPSQTHRIREILENNREAIDQEWERGKSKEYSLARSIFKSRTEATDAELFFELFFVANLTVFSSIHELDDGHSMHSPT